jgi:hypothetical protein
VTVEEGKIIVTLWRRDKELDRFYAFHTEVMNQANEMKELEEFLSAQRKR